MKKNPDSYPWASLDSPAYYSVPAQDRAQWKSWLMFFLALGFIYVGIRSDIWLSIIFGVLYLLTLFMDRNVVATERGVETYNNMHIAHHYECWKWEEMKSITFEKEANRPDKIKLHFAEETVSRSYYFPREDWGKIQAYAKAANPAIEIYDMSQLLIKEKPQTAKDKKRDKKRAQKEKAKEEKAKAKETK
jgi:hypothetical protein